MPRYASISRIDLMKKILILLSFFYIFSFASEILTLSPNNCVTPTSSCAVYPTSNGNCYNSIGDSVISNGSSTGVMYCNSAYSFTDCPSTSPIPCSPPPTPTCDFGYHSDTTPAKTCVPDKECPPAMKYFAQATGTFSFDIKTCTPDRDLSPSDCASKGGTYLTQFDSDPNVDLAMVLGTGCVDASYIANEYHAFGRSFLVSGLLPSINSAYLAKFAQTALSGGKSVYDSIKNFFKSDPVAAQQGLLTYKPEFIDLQIQGDGTYAVMDWKVKSQVWEDLTGGQANLKPYTVTTPDITPTNVYLGSDIAVVENSLIGTKSFLDNPQPLDVPSTSPLNTVTTSTLNLKNSLYGTETTSFPVTSTLLEKSTDTSGTVITKTQSRIVYPDGSLTNVTTLASRVTSGETTYNITATTPIQTTTGQATYTQGTILTTNSTGSVTNTISQIGTVSTTNSSGHVVTTPNVSNPTLAPQSDTGVINLSNIQASLNQLNKTATETKTVLEDLVNHVPVNTPAFNTKIAEFSSGLADLSLSIDNGFNFVNGLKNSLTDLENQFNDAKTIFENKPTITLQNGTCPFQSHWYGQTVTVDPCMFIAPYRSINTIFFTLIFSFAVLIFALKYLFDVRLGGK